MHKITSGSWGSALDSADATINESTAYTIKVARKQSEIVAALVGQSGAGHVRGFRGVRACGRSRSAGDRLRDPPGRNAQRQPHPDHAGLQL
ncbi:MAG: hypothetical protein WBE26_10120 [Phycisphaerae bacterium]